MDLNHLVTLHHIKVTFTAFNALALKNTLEHNTDLKTQIDRLIVLAKESQPSLFNLYLNKTDKLIDIISNSSSDWLEKIDKALGLECAREEAGLITPDEMKAAFTRYAMSESWVLKPRNI